MTPPTSFGVPNALNTLEHHPNTLKHYQNALKVFYYWCFRCFRSQVSCFGSGCCRRVASSVEDLGGLGERGDLADSREVIGVLLIGPLMRCELAMQKRLKACKDPTLRLQATRTV